MDFGTYFFLSVCMGANRETAAIIRSSTDSFPLLVIHLQLDNVIHESQQQLKGPQTRFHQNRSQRYIKSYSQFLRSAVLRTIVYHISLVVYLADRCYTRNDTGSYHWSIEIDFCGTKCVWRHSVKNLYLFTNNFSKKRKFIKASKRERQQYTVLVSIDGLFWQHQLIIYTRKKIHIKNVAQLNKVDQLPLRTLNSNFDNSLFNIKIVCC